MNQEQLKPDYIFEVSWEVCNKVGGIYTVITSKALALQKICGNRLMMIGPDLLNSNQSNDFEEDLSLFASWRTSAEECGLKLKIGRWKTDGNPIVFLVDFTPFLIHKNELFGTLWNQYKVDSLNGGWDYIEPAIFGHAAAKVIESFYAFHLSLKDKVVAQFHEWLTGAGLLRLNENVPQIATVFTTHATTVGRLVAGHGMPLYSNFNAYNGNEIARRFNCSSKHSLEKQAAFYADGFTTVSKITEKECVQFLQKKPDVITPNGFDELMLPNKMIHAKKRQEARAKLFDVAQSKLNCGLPHDALLIIHSGRYEFHNKGTDIFIDALGSLSANLNKTIVVFIFVPASHTGPTPENNILTHGLKDEKSDAILNRIYQNKLDNGVDNKVKVFFVPEYMNGHDGVFNLSYYDLLIGFDLSVFPSYYEPWGYTPLESLAFHIPSVTTNLSGFGKMISTHSTQIENGIAVLKRTDSNDQELVKSIAAIIQQYANKTTEEVHACRQAAFSCANTAQWKNYIEYYRQTYVIALNKAELRKQLYENESNLTVQSSPKIAYFCMEYGIASFFKIYSGGLGILAGDYLKEASDSGVNMVAVGLLYHNGYFKQKISAQGEQVVIDDFQKFSKLPLTVVRDKKGNSLKIGIPFPGRILFAKVWKAEVGRIDLYLLDTDIFQNNTEDKMITSRLYGGDSDNRIKQEMVLGMGGVRLLQVLDIHPDVYHYNEGHAAFAGLERLCFWVQNKKLPFDKALQKVRSSSLFTTHTPVAAGHDRFDENLLRNYLSYVPNLLNISWENLMALGRENENDSSETFSMSNLASRLSQEMNSVSAIHETVTKSMFKNLKNGSANIGHVTNGVHYPSWAAEEWQVLTKSVLGKDFLQNISDKKLWEKFYSVPDQKIWNIRLQLKKNLIELIDVLCRNDFFLEKQKNKKDFLTDISLWDDRTLFIGFARRFTGYKRAALLFSDLKRLENIIAKADCPVVFLFAGKAHPKDYEGQQLIKRIMEISSQDAFLGHIIFLQDYDIALAKYLTQGVDVWLNTPEPGMEASGTSGMKAALNGVLNCSVADGWWAEAANNEVGWTIPVVGGKNNNASDAEVLYQLLENEIIPLYFERNKKNIPIKWIAKIKSSMAQISPQFTTKRMIKEYTRKYYLPLSKKK
ncbi:MAG: alpha-glucan family phosphorylase [Bacteroidetes bacterium]|nr:alpha-glucan family phosphorylase [Bacteroidota bacterium]